MKIFQRLFLYILIKHKKIKAKINSFFKNSHEMILKCLNLNHLTLFLFNMRIVCFLMAKQNVKKQRKR